MVIHGDKIASYAEINKHSLPNADQKVGQKILNGYFGDVLCGDLTVAEIQSLPFPTKHLPRNMNGLEPREDYRISTLHEV